MAHSGKPPDFVSDDQTTDIIVIVALFADECWSA
jgi:hypothetical protein